MRLRNVAGLALALALFAGILGWLHERQQPPAQPPASRAWLPGLKPHQVTALCIATPGQPTIRARRDGKDWTLASKDGYPASGETIRQLLRSLADARLLEEKSASPENRERMGLSDQGKGQASRITLERGDAPPLVLLLGKRTSQGGQLVRQADDEGAWLIDRTVGLPVNDLALLDPRLTDLPFEQLRELTLSYGNGVRLNISRASEKDDGIRLQQFPSRPQLMGEAEAEQAARLFAALRLLEVAPAKASRQTAADLHAQEFRRRHAAGPASGTGAPVLVATDRQQGLLRRAGLSRQGLALPRGGSESGYRSRAPATQGIAGEAKQAGQALVAQVLSALARRRSQPAK